MYYSFCFGAKFTVLIMSISSPHLFLLRNGISWSRPCLVFPRLKLKGTGKNYPHAYFEGSESYMRKCDGDMVKTKGSSTSESRNNETAEQNGVNNEWYYVFPFPALTDIKHVSHILKISYARSWLPHDVTHGNEVKMSIAWPIFLFKTTIANNF